MDKFDCSLRKVLANRLEDFSSQWFDQKDLLHMCEDILKGLSYLHKENIAHRDLKSSGNNYIYCHL